MSLEEYRSKRRFDKTSEPEGQLENSEQNRFVIHKHKARHLHYDLRLELDGVLKSWAVPKGPPLLPGIRRLAVQVEDHPVDYIDFAGEIPAGEYGAGTVEIWDQGTYKLRRKEVDRLEFRAKGEQVSGDYILIRTDGKNWLLLKRKS